MIFVLSFWLSSMIIFIMLISLITFYYFYHLNINCENSHKKTFKNENIF
jgi:hypothetical protein